MKIADLQAYLGDELSYPVSQSTVLERVGAVEVEAPDESETETLANIVDGVGQESYDSAGELFATVIGNVSDEYIGRKFYDDRGGDPADTAAGPVDETDVSF